MSKKILDLVQLYFVETKQLKRQVRRIIKRFPEDFMVELNKEEFVEVPDIFQWHSQNKA